jgi:surface carbohydrate biosynthesis protein (TIGR04326 family)
MDCHYRVKKLLIIFDENIDIDEYNNKIVAADEIDIMPLTSRPDLVTRVEEICRRNFPQAGIRLLESAKLINREVDEIRKNISRWAADLGNYKIRGSSVKEWFLTPQKEVSTWWFSLVSEKNTLKTDAFFRISQLQAIDRIISSRSYGLCIFSVQDKHFAHSAKILFHRYSTDVYFISSLRFKRSLKSRLTSYVHAGNSFGLVLGSLILLANFLIKTIKAKFVMGSLKSRIRPNEKSVLFVSYFPAVDKELAKKGILKNEYAAFLQEKIGEMGEKIIWIWIYVYLGRWSYDEALKLAKRYADRGESNFMLEEFFSSDALANTAYIWFRQMCIYLKLRKLIPDMAMYEKFSIPESAAYMKRLMAESFIGPTSLEGIYYFELFKKILSLFPQASPCIYYAEMHAWEKGLNAANKLMTKKVKTIGFQHTNVAPNYFHYFHHENELMDDGKATALPLPDILACNGDIPFGMMKRQGYRNLVVVEAVRQLYLCDYMGISRNNKKENHILLVAGSYDPEETRLLLSLLHRAFPLVPQRMKIWVKGHPSAPVENDFDFLQIDYKRCGYQIKHDPIYRLLKEVGMVLVGFSNVALEALAFGCEVFIPVFSERMFISPLGGFERYYRKIYNAEELKEGVYDLGKNDRLGIENIDDNFIESYWCLDKSLARWEAIIK